MDEFRWAGEAERVESVWAVVPLSGRVRDRLCDRQLQTDWADTNTNAAPYRTAATATATHCSQLHCPPHFIHSHFTASRHETQRDDCVAVAVSSVCVSVPVLWMGLIDREWQWCGAVMAASGQSHPSYRYTEVRSGERVSVAVDIARGPDVLSAGGSRSCALLLLLLLNGVFCAALSGALLWTVLLVVRHPDTAAAADSSPSSLSSPVLPPSLLSVSVDRSLVSLGLPVSGSASLSSRTSLLTVMLMNRTATHLSQPAQQGTFVNTNLAGVTPLSFHSAIDSYYHSVCQRRLNAIVLHDIDPLQAADYYSDYQQRPYSFLGHTYTCNVTFVYAVHLVSARLYSNLHPYDLRWLLYHHFLRLHGSEYEWLLFTDVSDVSFEYNPFDFMVRQWYDDRRHPTLFIGRDPLIIQQHHFCKQRYEACKLPYHSFEERMAVNAGVMGGWRPHCQWLIGSLVRYYEHLVYNESAGSEECRVLGADMAVVNKLLLDPTTVDEPLQATPRPLPFNWYAEESGLVGGAFTGPFAFRRSVPGRQYIRHKTAWIGQQPQEWEHHLKNDNNTRDRCALLAE